MNAMLVIYRSQAALKQSFDKLVALENTIGHESEMMVLLEDKDMMVYLRSPEDIDAGFARGRNFKKILLPNNYINNPAFRSVLIPSAYGGGIIIFYPEDTPT